jgi:PAP2 superfamily
VNRRAALAAVAFFATGWVLGLGGVLPSANRWFLVLLAPALVYRRGWDYVRCFAPLALGVLVYEWARTLAHRLNPHPFYRPQIDVDKVIGLGQVPTVRLQGWLYHGKPRTFEHVLDTIHDWHVAFLLGALFLLWLDSHREYFRAAAAALGSAFAAAVGFLIFPAAPPWLAACHGLIGPLDRIREHGAQCPHLASNPALLTRLFDNNPVAAVPSLHGAWSTLVALMIWRWRPRLWPLGVAYALVQQFAVVYLGEHYVADLIAGDLLALGMWWLSGRLIPVQARERAISESIS